MIFTLWIVCTLILARFLFVRVPDSCQDAVIGWSIVALVMIYR
jgi:hypothetical protein